jgi:hypothetical protein
MGDIADYYVDLGMNEDNNIELGIDKGDMEDETERNVNQFGTKLVRCKYCGKSELHWEMTNKGYRLFSNDGVIHDCYIRENSFGLTPFDYFKDENEVNSRSNKTTNDQSIFYDWNEAKRTAISNIKPGQYSEIKTTVINNRMTYILTIKTKKY